MGINFTSFCVIVVVFLLCLQSRGERVGSVIFLDSPSQQFLRTRASDGVAETDALLLSEVCAAVAVLIGIAPPAKLSAASSSKLNEVLMPNPFNRPRAVFMLEVRVSEDSHVTLDSSNALFTSAFKSKVVSESSKADIELHAGDEVFLVSFDESSTVESDSYCTDELNHFASWLGGSYIADPLEPLICKLSIPLASGAHLDLDMSKKADRLFTTSLISLIRNMRKAMEKHHGISEIAHNPAELMTGSFDGIKGLQKQYGPEGVAEQGLELFLTVISKMFDLFQTAYEGQVVGVIYFNESPSETETMLNLLYTSRPPSRWLEETEGQSNSTAYAEVLLVRRTLAWITGIILLIGTLLGVYFLLNMPLTKDTLLYSNVKLD